VINGDIMKGNEKVDKFVNDVVNQGCCPVDTFYDVFGAPHRMELKGNNLRVFYQNNKLTNSINIPLSNFDARNAAYLLVDKVKPKDYAKLLYHLS